jgi:type III secretory pathway component EscS
VRRCAILAAVVLGLLGLLAGAPVAGARAVVAADAVDAVGSPRLVVVGAPGLSWSDIEGGDLPSVQVMAARGAVGSMTVRAVRSRSCAVDGWLTVSAGRRAADVAGPCREPLPVVGDRVPRWDEYLAAAAAGSYDAHPGTLAEGVTASGACVETVGPGAAIGGAEPRGVVTTHGPTLPGSFSCPVVLVDGGTLPESGAQRRAALERLDALVTQVTAMDAGADVIVAGVGDGVSAVRPRAVVASGPSYGRGLLTSASTRQPGVVQLQDLTATALTGVGASDAELTGRPLTVSASTGSAAEVLADRVGFETRAATLRAVSPQVTVWLAVAFALWTLVVAVLWWRGRAPGRAAGSAPATAPAAVPTWLRVAGVAVAGVPVSTFVANLVPWWRSGEPVAVFLVVVGVVVGLLTVAAWFAERSMSLGALRLVAVVTLLVLGGDVLSGSALQLGSVFGQNPIIGGRFYGLGNTSFALYGLAVLVVVGWVAAWGRSRGLSRGLSAGLAAVALVVALAVEALPAWGADFGGPPGLLLGGLVVIASAAGVRLTWGRVLVAVVGAGALAAVVAVLDWLRPAESRTHLGEFVQSVVSGEAGAVVGRKLAQNVANLASPPLLVIVTATVVLVVVAWRTGWRPVDAGTAVLRGAVVMAVVAFLVNDSGLVIPAFVALVLAPLLVAAGALRVVVHADAATTVVPAEEPVGG